MSLLVDEVSERTGSVPAISAGRRLRATMAAVRLSFVWFGVRKSLTSEQKAQAADAFGAEGDFLSAGKKLLDTRHPAFKAVTSVRSQLISLWRSLSLPYPEPGVRLIRQDDIELFNKRAQTLKAELADAVARLDEHFGELKSAARQRLGRLYNPADYPHSLRGLFKVEWDFPSVEPPQYLRELSPSLFAEEQRRVAARFDEAVRLAEEAFTSELGQLVAHLAERLSGAEDGKPKIFRDSAISNLQEFFARFQLLGVRSNAELDTLVESAQRIVRGVEPQQLRDQADLRRDIATQLAGVQSTLDGLMVDRPRRRILRGAVSSSPASEG